MRERRVASGQTTDASTPRNTRTPRVDPYPTRSSAPDQQRGRTPWIARPDPTVWSEPRTTDPWGLAQRHEYAEEGYAVVPGLLSPAEIQNFWLELDRMMADPELAGDHRVIREPESGAVRSIFDVHRMSEAVAAIARDERVLDVARQILGSDVYIHQSRINYMPGFTGNGFYWHSDFETWHAEDGLSAPRAVSLSIALTDNYPFNGGLMLVPGSHRHFVPGQGHTPQDNHTHSLVEQQVGVPGHDDITELTAEYGIDQFTGPAGSGLWFDSNMMHGSGNNITPYPRSNIFLVFNSVDNAPTEPFEAVEPRPAHIASRTTAALRRQADQHGRMQQR